MACSDWRPVVLDQCQDTAGVALAFWSTMQVSLRQVSIGTAEWVGRCYTEPCVTYLADLHRVLPFWGQLHTAPVNPCPTTPI